MKIVIIGATGTIGSALADALEAHPGYEVIRASRSGSVKVDLADPASIDALFAALGPVDAVVAVAASGTISRIDAPSDADYFTGLDAKLLGQVQLARRAARYLTDGGSVILTSGIFEFGEPGMSFTALVNAGLAGFVRTAAQEMPRDIRLNAVSPGWISETLRAIGRDTAAGTPVAEVVRAYVELLQGTDRGRVAEPGTPEARKG
ncbi:MULTISPECIES: short chain dehydrogenase [unclassified Streptomyces]|uniref:short chain dehydrogenase n=1 Tax=unclassified Streptomyces TaxID=2593676 RepID=UPI0003757A5A|nr:MULTISPECIES: short chain dehydrogenase [unclassified Streptomyces]MYT31391.1 short chain dehydrogenase [Streptomyces sp. SID8354]